MNRLFCLLSFVLIPLHLHAEDVPFPLWDESVPFPAAETIPLLENVQFSVIKKWEPEVDKYKWLHGVALAWHRGKLYASYGHNKGKENTASEEARYQTSRDGGKTWSEVKTIDEGTDADDLAVSHGVFLEHEGTLWAFHGAFNGHMKDIHTRAYRLNDASGEWEKLGTVVEDGFWPMTEPVILSDGNWIMPGMLAGVYSNKETFPAAVAISEGDNFLKWKLVKIPAPKGIHMWGESSLIVQGERLLNIARYGGKALPLLAESRDLGRTWTESEPANMPMTTSQPCAGVLSSGQSYLLCTTVADNGGRRSPLTIAVSKPGEAKLSKVFKIRDAVFPEGPGESHPKASLAYPYTTERDGKLYVGYSNSGGRGGNQNSGEMAVIPIEELIVP